MPFPVGLPNPGIEPRYPALQVDLPQGKPQYVAKTVLKGVFITIQYFLRKQGRYQINNLTVQLRQLEKEEEPTPKETRMKEIIEIIAETNDIEMKKTITKINETKSCFFFFFENINKIDKPLARHTK